jgi:hypothetical protein
MALTTRRQFVKQTAFAAAALYEHSIKGIAGARRILEVREQNAPPLDATAIRKLVSQISGHVITPETPTMNRHAWFSTAHSTGIRP